MISSTSSYPKAASSSAAAASSSKDQYAKDPTETHQETDGVLDEEYETASDETKAKAKAFYASRPMDKDPTRKEQIGRAHV